MSSLPARLLKVLMLVYVLSSNATAGTLKNPEEAKSLVERAMAKVGAGDSAGGIQMIRPFLIIPPAEFDVMLDQLRLQEPVIAQRFGKSIGHEFIREERVGENLYRIVQIHRFERHAMRWTFYFYRGSEGWVLNTFKTDDDVSQLFGR